MSTNELYACAYKEVIIILSLLPDEDWNKIPQTKKDFYFNNMNKDYKFDFDYSKSIEEQKLLKLSEAILANLYKEYLASPDEKQQINIREKKEFYEIEEEKRRKYNPKDIFKKVEDFNEVDNANLPVPVKKIKICERIFNYIKKKFLGG